MICPTCNGFGWEIGELFKGEIKRECRYCHGARFIHCCEGDCAQPSNVDRGDNDADGPADE